MIDEIDWSNITGKVQTYIQIIIFLLIVITFVLVGIWAVLV